MGIVTVTDYVCYTNNPHGAYASRVRILRNYLSSMAQTPLIEELLRVGAHFGHRAAKWHPNMKTYLYAKRDGVHIIDLRTTAERLEKAEAFLNDLGKQGKTVVFVGTKRQAKEPVTRLAQAASVPYVTTRWIGGMLTNFETIQTRIKRLQRLRSMFTSGEAAEYPKKEQLLMQDEMASLEKNFQGVDSLQGVPDALFVVDMRADKIAVQEAKKLGVTVIALADSNVDPTDADVAIPCNDDALQTIEFVVGRLINAYAKDRVVKTAAKQDARRTVAAVQMGASGATAVGAAQMPQKAAHAEHKATAGDTKKAADIGASTSKENKATDTKQGKSASPAKAKKRSTSRTKSVKAAKPAKTAAQVKK